MIYFAIFVFKLFYLLKWCLERDLNPYDYSSVDFESTASAIPPSRQKIMKLKMLSKFLE